MTATGNWSRLMACCSRYKLLAQEYKAMYPTLETDVEGELLKLKVTCSKSATWEKKQGKKKLSSSPLNVLCSMSELRREDQAHGEGRCALHVRGPPQLAQEDPGRRSQRSLTGHRLRSVCGQGLFWGCDRITTIGEMTFCSWIFHFRPLTLFMLFISWQKLTVLLRCCLSSPPHI